MTNTAYLDDVECGALGTLQLKVEFDYTPEDDGGDEYPSSPEDYDITGVWIVLPPEPGIYLPIPLLPGMDYQALVDLIRETQ